MIIANEYECVVCIYVCVGVGVVHVCLVMSVCRIYLSQMLIFTCVAWVAFAVGLIRASSRRVAVEGTCATLSTAVNRLVLPSAACQAGPTMYTCVKVCVTS